MRQTLAPKPEITVLPPRYWRLDRDHIADGDKMIKTTNKLLNKTKLIVKPKPALFSQASILADIQSHGGYQCCFAQIADGKIMRSCVLVR